jgi:hypothetical protein
MSWDSYATESLQHAMDGGVLVAVGSFIWF